MNLIGDKWIPVIDQSGTAVRITPWQLTQTGENGDPFTAIDAPRADFNGALAQFLIGLLQTAFAPKDDRAWARLYENPPTPDELKNALLPWRDAFNLDGKGPRFMQDTDLSTEDLRPLEIGALLIDGPGGNTEDLNLDHFVKRGLVQALSPAAAALALFTLQTNAPAGGVGYRTSLRGGGPLTTLVVPDPAATPEHSSLWHTIWLNVPPEKRLRELIHNPERSGREDMFPWLAPTRHSNLKAGGLDTTPQDAHPVQMYWGMPRRILLDMDDPETGDCDLSGERGPVVRRFRARNYGVNYTGAWVHPLSPHRRDKDGQPIPLHPQPGGFGYRHWLGLVLGEGPDNAPAEVVRWTWTRDVGPDRVRLWVFGYDMNNMKARCWYESLMPVWHMDAETAADLAEAIHDVLSATRMVANNLRQSLKNAWIRKGVKTSGDLSFIQNVFWQYTESAFYDLLASMHRILRENGDDTPLRQRWFRIIHDTTIDLFDTWAASADLGEADPKRIALARSELSKFNHKKAIRQALYLDTKNTA